MTRLSPRSSDSLRSGSLCLSGAPSGDAETWPGLEIILPLTFDFLSNFQILHGEIQVLSEMAQASERQHLSKPVSSPTTKAWPRQPPTSSATGLTHV